MKEKEIGNWLLILILHPEDVHIIIHTVIAIDYECTVWCDRFMHFHRVQSHNFTSFFFMSIMVNLTQRAESE